MPSTFDTVANIISETCDIPRDTIKPESHAINDLGIDSLDFLDIAFAIDKAFGIKMPLEQWTQEVNDGKATTKRTRVTLLTDRGLQQFILEDAENLQFTDAALRDKVGQALMADPKNWDPQHGPGDNYFRYTNLNFPIVGSIVEKATGERFDIWMRREVLEPMRLEIRRVSRGLA